MYYFLLIMFSIFAFLILLSSHPILMISSLICSTLVLSFSLSILLKNSWISLIFILLMLGGVLILFIYMASLTANESFQINKSLIIYFFLIIYFLKFKKETLNLFLNPNLLKDLFSNLNLFLIFFCISYLLFALVIVIEIIQSYKSALRSFF